MEGKKIFASHISVFFFFFFASHISYNGLVSRINKELLNPNNKRQMTQIKKKKKKKDRLKKT